MLTGQDSVKGFRWTKAAQPTIAVMMARKMRHQTDGETREDHDETATFFKKKAHEELLEGK